MSKKERTKVPYLIKDDEKIPIKSKDLLLELNLSVQEVKFIKQTDLTLYHFRNGINIFDDKYPEYNFRVYYITGLKSLSYLEYIEKEWRRKYGLLKLCTYKSGR